MKVTLVSPEFPFSGRVPMVPPILEYLGALTLREQPGATLQLVDANQTRLLPEDVRGDLVGLSVWTATAPWVYRFADACRARGLRVVLGGIHATALPDEAGRHADAVVVGEAESVWGEVLRDAAAGRLRPRYDGVRLPLAGLPLLRFHLVDHLLKPFQPPLQDGQIGVGQLQVHGADVAARVHGALRMGHRLVLEGPHHVQQELRVEILVDELSVDVTRGAAEAAAERKGRP